MSISHPVSPPAPDTTPSVPATDLHKGEAADHAFSLEEEEEEVEGHRIRSAVPAATTSSEEEHTYITSIHCYIIGVCMHAYG